MDAMVDTTLQPLIIILGLILGTRLRLSRLRTSLCQYKSLQRDKGANPVYFGSLVAGILTARLPICITIILNKLKFEILIKFLCLLYAANHLKRYLIYFFHELNIPYQKWLHGCINKWRKFLNYEDTSFLYIQYLYNVFVKTLFLQVFVETLYMFEYKHIITAGCRYH